MASEQTGNYICRFCKGSFTQSQHLFKHVQQIHAASPSTKNSRTCPICGNVFNKYEAYRTHLRHLHGQRNEGQTFAFKCFNDFFLWKTELEERMTCKYALQSAPKLLPSNEKLHVYQCDQSVVPLKRKKCSSAVRDSCPAMICATESLKNRETKVEYWNTHVGHPVPVEDDELSAAVHSLQSEETSMPVMEMLNSIGQSIETGPEVYVETIEEEPRPFPKFNQKNIFSKNIFNNKAKKSIAPFTNSTPIVQNFSFKKDPSKKKESSIYSLASVACGKVSASKSILKSKEEKNTTDTIVPLSVSPVTTETDEITNNCPLQNSQEKKIAVPSEKVDTTVSIPATTSNAFHDTSCGGRFIAINPLPTSSSKREIVCNWVLPTGMVASASQEAVKTSSSTQEVLKQLGEKTLQGKENALPVETTMTPIMQTVPPNDKSRSLLKPSKNAKSKKVSPTSTPLPVHNQLVRTSISTSSPTFTTPRLAMQPGTTVLPAPQAYLSINSKLIPIINTPGPVLPSNLNSNFFLPSALPQSSVTNFKLNSGTTAKAIVSSPITVTGTVPSVVNSPLIMVPCTNNSTISSTAHSRPPGLIVSSPLVSNSIRPMAPVPVRSTISIVPGTARSIGPSTMLTRTPSILRQTVPFSVSSPHITPHIGKSSTAVPNSVKVQKVSLPIESNSQSTTSIGSKQMDGTCSQLMERVKQLSQGGSKQSQVNNIVQSTSSISSTPSINIPQLPDASVKKPTTYVFESSGELYMLEPLDDDMVVKNSTPATSTPKKSLIPPRTSQFMTPTSPVKRKRKHKKPPKTPEIVPKKLKTYLDKSPKKTVIQSSVHAAMSIGNNSVPNVPSTDDVTTTVETVPPTSGAITTVQASFSSDTSLTEVNSEHSLVRNPTLNNEITLSPVTKSPKASVASSVAKTEMVITIAKSKSSPLKKEVSFITKKPPCEAIQSAASFLTVKTVPSYSFPQSRTVTSVLSSTTTSSSHIVSTPHVPRVTVASYTPSYMLSSAQRASTSSFSGVLSTPSGLRDGAVIPSISTSEVPDVRTTQHSEVKRGVTIKSVAQEKKTVSDDDLEIMKKVKYYKLEMKYFACQEQCKKLKIELAKALSKNRELAQSIEEKVHNEKSEKEPDNSANESPAAKQQLPADGDDEQRIASGRKDASETIPEKESGIEAPEILLDKDTVNKELEVSGKEINAEIGVEGVPDCQEDTALIIEAKDLINEKESQLSVHEQTDVLVEEPRVDDEQEDMDMQDESDDEEGDNQIEASSSTSVEKEILDNKVVKETNVQENVNNIEESDISQKTEKESKENTTDKTFDVYTMIRTSKLRDLYSEIRDLLEEKNQLQQDLENYRHDPVFSMQE